MRDAAAVVEVLDPVQTTGGDVKTMYQGDVVVGRRYGCCTLNPAAAIEQ